MFYLEITVFIVLVSYIKAEPIAPLDVSVSNDVEEIGAIPTISNCFFTNKLEVNYLYASILSKGPY